MALTILYFAGLREMIGVETEQVDVPAHVGTVDALADWLAGRSAGHARAFADRVRIRAAVDQQFAPFESSIAGAREVAFFPPVTGG